MHRNGRHFCRGPARGKPGSFEILLKVGLAFKVSAEGLVDNMFGEVHK